MWQVDTLIPSVAAGTELLHAASHARHSQPKNRVLAHHRVGALLHHGVAGGRGLAFWDLSVGTGLLGQLAHRIISTSTICHSAPVLSMH